MKPMTPNRSCFPNNANVTITAGSIAARMQKSYDTSNTSLRLDFTTSTSGSNVTISATATFKFNKYIASSLTNFICLYFYLFAFNYLLKFVFILFTKL